MTTSSGCTAKRRRTTAPPAAAATVPHDLPVSEVLTRLPVKSLMRAKSVCRSWRAAVEHPEFVRRHLDLARSRSPPSLLVIPREGDPEEASESEGVSFHRLVLDDARRPGTADVALMFEKALPGMTNALVPTHCDGLVALATATGQIFVCNPATREFVALPPGSPDVLDGPAAAAALCYDQSRDRYVVARYFYRRYDVTGTADSPDYDIGHEIFTLGGESSSWAATADPPHAIGPATRPVCTRDAVYWCTDSLRPNALLRFNLRDGAFDVAPCPPGTDFHRSVDHVTELAGKLCYAHTVTATAFDVWVADDDDATRLEWSLRCRVDFGLFGASVGAEALLPVAATGDETLLAADHRTLYSYAARRGSVVKVVDLEDELAYDSADGSEPPYYGDLVHHVVPYVESLVSISCRQAMQKPD